MGVVAYIETRPARLSKELDEYLSEQVSAIARCLAADGELKEELLQKGEHLVEIMKMLAENPVSLTNDAIFLVRDNLRWMEEYLDGELKIKNMALDSNQYNRLKKIYLDIAEALCTLTIQADWRTAQQ